MIGELGRRPMTSHLDSRDVLRGGMLGNAGVFAARPGVPAAAFAGRRRDRAQQLELDVGGPSTAVMVEFQLRW